MASAADSYLVQTSMIKDDETPDFTSKQWTFVNDINQGNYGNKQVQFDMTGFFNAARFMSFSEMVLVIPLVTVLTPDDLYTDSTSASLYSGLGPTLPTAGSAAKPNNLYSMGFKSGYWNLIYSMSVNADGVDAVQLQPNLNYYASYKANTTWSASDVAKHGPLCGFLPDDELSWGINPTYVADKNGYGVYNNTLPAGTQQLGYAPPTTGSSANYSILDTNTPHVNNALYERMCKTSTYVSPLGINSADQIVVTGDAPASWDSKYVGQSDGTLSSQFTSNLKDAVFVMDPPNDNTWSKSARVWITTAYIRLKDVCDFFSKLPLCRSLGLKLIINVNLGHLSVRQPTLGVPYGLDPSGTSADFSKAPVSGNANPPTVFSTIYPTAGYQIGDVAGKSISLSTLECATKTTGAGVIPQNWPNTAGGVVPVYGYGQIYDNSFSNTCPIMLAKCVSSLNTNNSSRTPETPLLNQVIEQDIFPGVNCGIYSQQRNGLRLSINIATPDTNYHPQQASALAGFSHPLKSCRIYVPSVEMVPSKAIRYLENHKQQMVEYDDIYTFTYNGIKPGQQFNYMAANNVANAKYLIVIPFFHDDTVKATGPNGSASAQHMTSTPANWNRNCSACPFEPISPFDSAPATTAPYGMLQRYNVLLSNQTVYQRDREYDFETFLEEVSEANAINGGLDTGLTSGLVDFRKWSNNYRYYVTNLARRLEGDNTPKSITLQGTNGTILTMDLQIFVVYSKKISLDVGTGRISV